MLQKKNSNNHVLLNIIAVALLFISGASVIYSIRVGVAQVIYHKVKIVSSLSIGNVDANGADGSLQGNDILIQCQKAQRLYPYNYQLMVWGAEEAFARSQSSTEEDKVKYINLAETFCDRGLSLNRYVMPLPYIKMQLLCIRSPKDGISYWEKYVEWDYWNSYNHAVLASLYAADGKFGKAMQSLQFIKGTEDYAEANKIVQDYWDADSAMPPSLR